MPPRRRAAGEDDGCPTLKLKFVKGPLSGQTSEFSSRSVIRIGRVVRGNTIAVKDPGVSTKHLLIQVETTPDSSQRRWTITDLGSSNGTILNVEKLEEPAVLSDGDVIKIGEMTSIIVEFEGGNEISSKSTRNNARKPVKDQATDFGVIDELGFENKEDEKETDGVKDPERKDSNTEENKDLGINGVNKLPVVSTRRTRRSKKEGGDIEALIDLSVIENKKPRGRKKKVVETIPKETEKEEGKVTEEESCSGAIPEETEKEAGKVAEESCSGAIPEETEKEAGKVAEESCSGAIPEETEKEAGKVAEESCSGAIPEETEKEAGKVAEESCSGAIPEETEKEAGKVAEESCSGAIPEETEKEAGKVAEEINAGKEDGALGLGSTSGVKENNVNTGKGKKVADLETMTMGEWFDFLEVYLPQQIIEKSEAKIAEMRQTAERLHKYVVQQKKLKGQQRD